MIGDAFVAFLAGHDFVGQGSAGKTAVKSRGVYTSLFLGAFFNGIAVMDCVKGIFFFSSPVGKSFKKENIQYCAFVQQGKSFVLPFLMH